jgi:hypothetical protein
MRPLPWWRHSDVRFSRLDKSGYAMGCCADSGLARSFAPQPTYLGLLCLVLPEALFWLFGRDTDPRLWWILGVGLVAYGLIGRVKDQGIDRSKLSSSSITAFLALALPLIGGWEGMRNDA